MSEEFDVNVERAKLAEQAERYDDMAEVSLCTCIYVYTVYTRLAIFSHYIIYLLYYDPPKNHGPSSL